MSSWITALVLGCFFFGVAVGIAVGSLFTGAANSELAERNWRLGQENERLNRLVGAVTEELS